LLRQYPKLWVTLLALPALSGCHLSASADGHPDTVGFSHAPPAAFTSRLPPAEVGKLIEEHFSRPESKTRVATISGGEIITDYSDFEGEAHGLLRRKWQEHTRFQIWCRPSFDHPLGDTVIEVYEETQQRPTTSYPWDTEPPLSRPDRAIKVVNELKEVLRRAEHAAGAGAASQPIGREHLDEHHQSSGHH
jgi:hypothetical protein